MITKFKWVDEKALESLANIISREGEIIFVRETTGNGEPQVKGRPSRRERLTAKVREKNQYKMRRIKDG